MKAVRCFLLLLLQKAVQCIWVAHHGTADKQNTITCRPFTFSNSTGTYCTSTIVSTDKRVCLDCQVYPMHFLVVTCSIRRIDAFFVINHEERAAHLLHHAQSMSDVELWADMLPVDGLYGHVKHPHLGLVHLHGNTISCGYVQLHGNHHFMWPCTPAWTSPFHAALQGHSLHKTQTGHRPEQRWSRVYIQLADSIATYFAWAYEQKQRTSDKTGYFAQLT